MINASYAKAQAEKFEMLANDQAEAHGEGSLFTREHREDEAYWRGIWWALSEVERETHKEK